MRRVTVLQKPPEPPVPAIRTYAGRVADQLVRGAEMDTPVSGYYLVTRGLAQLFLPPDTEVAHVERKLVFDLDYARRQGLVLDVRILLCTALKLFGLPAAALRKMLPVRRLDVDEMPSRRAA